MNVSLIREKCPVAPLEKEWFSVPLEHVMFDINSGILRGQGGKEFLDPLPLVSGDQGKEVRPGGPGLVPADKL
jgi:hypothetical protein